MSLALQNVLTGVAASIPSPSISYFDLGPLRIHIYALCIITGIIVAVLWTNARLTKRGAEPWVVIDIALLAVPLAIITARIYHVLAPQPQVVLERACRNARSCGRENRGHTIPSTSRRSRWLGRSRTPWRSDLWAIQFAEQSSQLRPGCSLVRESTSCG